VIFGATLNLTPISVLGALVLFMAMWGICGGILSVQLLAIIRIVCQVRRLIVNPDSQS
jgi:predicted PurR-regulated permease PerM